MYYFHIVEWTLMRSFIIFLNTALKPITKRYNKLQLWSATKYRLAISYRIINWINNTVSLLWRSYGFTQGVLTGIILSYSTVLLMYNSTRYLLYWGKFPLCFISSLGWTVLFAIICQQRRCFKQVYQTRFVFLRRLVLELS